MDEWGAVKSNCMLGKEKCSDGDCSKCGFSWKEDERRRKLPLVKLDNGLYGKRVGKRKRPED